MAGAPPATAAATAIVASKITFTKGIYRDRSTDIFRMISPPFFCFSKDPRNGIFPEIIRGWLLPTSYQEWR
jgi:hypothetical protein